MADDLPELVVPDATAWRRWLGANAPGQPGVWLVLSKQGTNGPTRLTHDEALDEALCHGWIDGQVRRRDDVSFRQRFTPRRARSPWSRRNVGIVARLEKEGRMGPGGRAEVERARVDGRWAAAYAGPATIEMPADLAAALAAAPEAQATFATLTSQNRYAILYRLATAKRADTRARRVDQFVAMLARGETLHPQKRPSSPDETHKPTSAPP
jgi:uncharacterized protein YdeI (YjbR/CyaY-like superfamily)